MISPAIVKFIYSVCIGIGGAIVLLMFGSVVVPDERLLNVLPWILGFNGLVAGYSLLDKTEEPLRKAIFRLVGMGLLITLPFFFVINMSTFFLFNLTIRNLLMVSLVTGIGTLAGGWLAGKHQQIKT